MKQEKENILDEEIKDSEKEKVPTYWSYGGQFANKCLLFPPHYMTHLTSDFNTFKVRRKRNKRQFCPFKKII